MNAHGYIRVGEQQTYGGHRPQPVPTPPPPPPAQATEEKGLLSKAVSWAKAEASLLIQGPLPDADYEHRIAQCLACPMLDRHPDQNKIGWCKACGCGRKDRAELTVKGRMPKSTCPKGKWPKVP